MHDCDLGLDIGDDVLEQPAAVGDVDGNEGHPEKVGAEPDPDDVGPVRQKHQDAIALSRAEPVKAARGAPGLIVGLGIGPALRAEEVDEIALRVSAGPRFQRVCEDGADRTLDHLKSSDGRDTSR